MATKSKSSSSREGRSASSSRAGSSSSRHESSMRGGRGGGRYEQDYEDVGRQGRGEMSYGRGRYSDESYRADDYREMGSRGGMRSERGYETQGGQGRGYPSRGYGGDYESDSYRGERGVRERQYGGQQYSDQRYEQDRSQFNRPSRASYGDYGQVEGDYRDEPRGMRDDSSRGYQETQGYRAYDEREGRNWEEPDDRDAYQEALRAGAHDEDIENEDTDYSRATRSRRGRSSRAARH